MSTRTARIRVSEDGVRILKNMVLLVSKHNGYVLGEGQFWGIGDVGRRLCIFDKDYRILKSFKQATIWGYALKGGNCRVMLGPTSPYGLLNKINEQLNPYLKDETCERKLV